MATLYNLLRCSTAVVKINSYFNKGYTEERGGVKITSIVTRLRSSCQKVLTPRFTFAKFVSNFTDSRYSNYI